MIPTIAGASIDAKALENYLRTLINLFFKILPLWENGEASLGSYMRGLRAELLGCNELLVPIRNDAEFMSLVLTLEYLIGVWDGNIYVSDEEIGCQARITEGKSGRSYKGLPREIPVIRHRVFRAISICKDLIKRYSEKEGVVG